MHDPGPGSHIPPPWWHAGKYLQKEGSIFLCLIGSYPVCAYSSMPRVLRVSVIVPGAPRQRFSGICLDHDRKSVHCVLDFGPGPTNMAIGASSA
jgi:hypothetical protein